VLGGNGLALEEVDRLRLALATESEAGAMSAEDKARLGNAREWALSFERMGLAGDTAAFAQVLGWLQNNPQWAGAILSVPAARALSPLPAAGIGQLEIERSVTLGGRFTLKYSSGIGANSAIRQWVTNYDAATAANTNFTWHEITPVASAPPPASMPVSGYYTQYPISGQAALAGMFPAAEAPAALFGGTWSLQYDTEEVFFRTPGVGGALGARRGQSWGGSWVAGVAGIEPDAIRNIQGHAFRMDGTNLSPNGPFAMVSLAGASTGRLSGGSASNSNSIDFSASRTVPTDTANRPRNRLIRIWKRLA